MARVSSVIQLIRAINLHTVVHIESWDAIALQCSVAGCWRLRRRRWE